MQPLRAWLLESVACPIDGARLTAAGDRLTCPARHEFPIIDGIPMLLATGHDPTHPYCARTLDAVKGLGTPGSDAARRGNHGGVDPFVQDEIVKTNGNLYRHLRGRLPRYPIPTLRLPPGDGRTLLDVGCNWGRWTLAAGRAGYRAIGVDPWIEAARAGQRVARQLDLDVAFVVGDARHLPFADHSFDASFS